MTNKNFAKQIIEVPAQDELDKSFLEYSMSVVYSRALPSIDGLQPVQRRIVYRMFTNGYLPTSPYAKATRPVADVMGTLHPHGDSSIFGALCKLAQPFYMNVPLVDGYGNFGDVTGSGPAAARYVEARLTKAALLAVDEVGEDTVDMFPNYDGQEEEPGILPVRFPVLLVNGNFGIGVGFSSKLAPHNSDEVMNAVKFLLKNPDASLKQVMKYLPGPDFPTGGLILGTDGIESAYETGQAIIRVRAKTSINPIGRGKHEIIISEMPYETATEALIARIQDCLKEGKLQGLADARDLTDRKNGLRVVIETKAGIRPDVLLEELFKETSMEKSFGINNTILVNGEPRVVGMLEILRLFIELRESVVLRRSAFRKQKRETRLHLVNGLLKALVNIDAVIKIVRAAKDASEARDNLIKKFKIDEVQADYILGIALRRLTKFDQLELEKEKKKLEEEIAELDSIIKDPAVLKAVLLKEFEETRKVISQPRRSEIVGGSLAEHLEAAKTVVAKASVEVEDEPCFVSLTLKGGFVRTSNAPSRAMTAVLSSTLRNRFVAVTSAGRGFKVDTLHVGTKETVANNVLPVKLARGEKVVALAPLSFEGDKPNGIVFGTVDGVVKVVTPVWPKTLDEFSVMKLEKGDSILSARWVEDTNDYVFAFVADTSNILCFEGKAVRPQGLTGGGMAGIKLGDGAKAVAFGVVAKNEVNDYQFTTCTSKSIKTSKLSEIPLKGRATQGMRGHKFNKGEDKLILASVAKGGILLSVDGSEIPLPKVSKRDAAGSPIETSGLF